MKKGIRNIILAGAVLLASASVAEAARGISVSPSEIMGDMVTEWPYVTSIEITNTGLETEWIEIAIPGNDEALVYVEPSRFPLAEAEVARVLVTFYEPLEKMVGKLEITATRSSAGGLETGTGIELPYAVSKSVLTQGDMRAAVLAGTGGPIGGMMKVFVWMLFLSTVLFVMVVMARRISRRL